MKLLLLLSGSAIAALAAPALAAEAPSTDAAPHDRTAPGDYHAEPGQDIVVTAPFRRELGAALSGTSILSGEELTRELKPTIGETLAHQPGVSATSFGPNASRPVLRGFQGERVRVLTDGIGSFDVSNTSVDHAVAINPLTADRIEVLRGPAALLFGSSAIGGVVNVIDSRIPRKLPDEPVHVQALGTLGSAADERAVSGAVEAPIGGKIVVHVDGSYSKTDDLEIGGHALSRPLREQAAASADPAIAGLADIKGTLPNSAARTWEVAGGAAVITETGNLGFSVSHLDSRYGVPVRYSLDPTVEAEQVRIAMKQTRADVRAEVDTGGNVIEKIRFRAGWADYQHAELEEDGAVGTRFFSDAWEGRLELVQAAHGGWRGATGVQGLIRNFDVIGDEAFLPKNETQQFGLFTLQEVDLGRVKVEGGARYEPAIARADANAALGNPALDRRFDAYSGSLGASLEVAQGIRVGLNGSRSERAPSAEELFANGPHAGTQAFEIGDTDLSTEKSWGLEATLNGRGDGYSFGLSAYHSWFDDYIYDTQTGAIADGLPVYQVRQANARYYGFEAEASVTLAHAGDYAFNLDGVADYVRAKLTNSGDLPRIPPLRLLGGVEAQSDRLSGRVEVEWTAAQKKLAAFETETGAFTMVNASASIKPFASNPGMSIVLSANNLFDVVGRRHASFLKDYAPLAGRDLRVSARVSF
jgi:iron complex outermembrane receptor protein